MTIFNIFLQYFNQTLLDVILRLKSGLLNGIEIFQFPARYDYVCTLEIPSNEIPSNERSLIRARYRSLQRAADQSLYPHYYGIKRARIWNSS